MAKHLLMISNKLPKIWHQVLQLVELFNWGTKKRWKFDEICTIAPTHGLMEHANEKLKLFH